jgi:hypothetical protein
MPQTDTPQPVAYENIVLLLRWQLGLNEARCYEVARPQDITTVPPGGDYFLTVAWGDSDYPRGEQFPGNFTENAQITVSIYTRVKRDRAAHDRFLLLDEKRGLLVVRNLVHAALINQSAGISNIRSPIEAIHSTPGDLVQGGPDSVDMGVLRATYAVGFDCQLPTLTPGA